jgi:hypothetical protein
MKGKARCHTMLFELNDVPWVDLVPSVPSSQMEEASSFATVLAQGPLHRS